MGLFRRQRPDLERSADLPLTTDRATRLRSLVRTAFAEAGREVTVYADHVVDDEGTRFGLWNLAATCNGEPEREWPAIVSRHIQALVAPKPTLETLTDDQLRPMVRSRIQDRAALPDPGRHPHAAEIGGDLVEVLCVDLPDSVVTPAESEFSGRGALGPWLDTGRANLHADLLSAELEHERLSPPDGLGAFEVLMGDSVYTASFALFLPALLARAHRADQGRGVLVALPFRHQVGFRVVDGEGPDLAMALQHLFRFAISGYDEAPGGLSPHVYWVHDGRWQQVTEFDEEGRPGVHVDDDLGRALGLDQG